MLNNLHYQTARDILLDATKPLGKERLPLKRCGGRILAEALVAAENIPPFDRSPYDGYALRATDTESASKEYPVCLRILEEIPAGAVPTMPITAGTASKVLTGAPIPPGADVVIMFEKTEFTPETVTVFTSLNAGDNIVRAGEDVAKGTLLADIGTVIDPGLAGTLAAQGVAEPLVYNIPKIGLLSTGSELVGVDAPLEAGKIRNSNRYMLEAAVATLGCQPIYLGTAGDSVEGIAALLEEGVEECDAVVTTGGVSVGDYDLTPAAMEAVGAELLFRGVDIKPGMACAYATKAGKLICGLSGNPASAITNFYVVAVPALRKLAGRHDPNLQEISVVLKESFPKKSSITRFLCGKLELSDGIVRMSFLPNQGNVVISSAVGCNVMAEVLAGSGPVPAGTKLKGFLL